MMEYNRFLRNGTATIAALAAGAGLLLVTPTTAAAQITPAMHTGTLMDDPTPTPTTSSTPSPTATPTPTPTPTPTDEPDDESGDEIFDEEGSDDLSAESGDDSKSAFAAAAAPSRQRTKTRPIIFVHGWNRSANTNCDSYWKTARSFLKGKGFTGALRTFGYYRGDSKCSKKFNGTTDTRIQEVGRQLAWYIYNTWTKNGKAVDVVAHSMGGLVTRAAIEGVNRYGGDGRWPKRLYIEDVVTLATPHAGSNFGTVCAVTHEQCSDMRPGSGFLEWLSYNPDSQMATEYSAFISNGDQYVSVKSGTNNYKADNWIVFKKQTNGGGAMNHTSIRNTKSGKWHATYPSGNRTTESPLHRSAYALEEPFGL